jgi:hypothetical protein
MKAPHENILTFLIFAVVMIACNDDRPDPPNGWTQKVNNNKIDRITLVNQASNCAFTEKKNIVCRYVMDSLDNECMARVAFNDGSPEEIWTTYCPEEDGVTYTLIFDDGKFSYFYGRKRNP